MPKLTDRGIQAKKEPGMYGDGNGLYLRVGPTGAKSWILRTRIRGRRARTEFGLGSTAEVTLAEARESARAWRKLAKEGRDPRIEFRKPVTPTLEEAARTVHKALVETFRSQKHQEVWIASLERYAFPQIGARPIDDVGTADMLSVLAPIWTEKHDTAKRIKQRLATVFDWARGSGHYPSENPLNGITRSLPSVKYRPQHMAAMPWQDVPGFMSDLSDREGISARTLEFLILTAARSGEARGARWSEISGDVWSIPGERTKTGEPHRVPLSEEAVSVLEDVRGLDTELVFPSIQRGKQGEAREQSVMVFKALRKRMGREGFTAHGFRSTFRDWCGESARADREVAEACLAHSVGNKVEKAYARSDLFERRRVLMDAWGRYAKGKAGDVVHMVRA